MVVFITPSYMDIVKSGKVDSLSLAIKKHEDSIKASTYKNRKSTNANNKPEKTTTDRIRLKK